MENISRLQNFCIYSREFSFATLDQAIFLGDAIFKELMPVFLVSLIVHFGFQPDKVILAGTQNEPTRPNVPFGTGLPVPFRRAGNSRLLQGFPRTLFTVTDVSGTKDLRKSTFHRTVCGTLCSNQGLCAEISYH